MIISHFTKPLSSCLKFLKLDLDYLTKPSVSIDDDNGNDIHTLRYHVWPIRRVFLGESNAPTCRTV